MRTANATQWLGKLKKIGQLPMLPTVVMRLEHAMQGKNASAESIGQLVSEDVSLVAKILQVVNSMYYSSQSKEISSIPQAIARLGFRELRRISFMVGVMQTFTDVGHIDHKIFWKHSLMTALTTRVIRKFCQKKLRFDEDTAYTAGLLHDVGLLILSHFFADSYLKARLFAQENDLSNFAAELEILGLDHGEIGGALLCLWNLPNTIVEAVSWHHQPGRCDMEFSALVSSVHLAESICTCIDIGGSADDFASEFMACVWVELELSPNDVPKIVEQVLEEAEKCESLLVI